VSAVLPWVLFVGLLVHVGAHLALVVGLARAREREPSVDSADAAARPAWLPFVRAAVALVVAPLAPLWGWKAGLRRTTLVWCGGLALYAAGVALA